jgi:hypothetical protein
MERAESNVCMEGPNQAKYCVFVTGFHSGKEEKENVGCCQLAS